MHIKMYKNMGLSTFIFYYTYPNMGSQISITKEINWNTLMGTKRMKEIQLNEAEKKHMVKFTFTEQS